MKHYKENHMFKSKKKSSPLDVLGALKPKKKRTAHLPLFWRTYAVSGAILGATAYKAVKYQKQDQ